MDFKKIEKMLNHGVIGLVIKKNSWKKAFLAQI